MRTPTPAAASVPAALLAILGLAVAGCGASQVRTPPEPPPAGASASSSGTGSTAETVLTIHITAAGADQQSGAAEPTPSPSAPAPSTSPVQPRHWQLTCRPAGGDHPDPEAACADLAAAGGAAAFEEVPADRPCTFIYGGPQVARVKGHVGDTPIDTEFTKSGGCEMQRYEDLGAVLAP
ncbi:hypothetical protein GCM10027570_33540 [Streptomonospora sediminis]